MCKRVICIDGIKYLRVKLKRFYYQTSEEAKDTLFLHSSGFHSFTIPIQLSKLMKISSGDVQNFTHFTGSDEKKILFGINSQSPFRFHPLLIMIRD